MKRSIAIAGITTLMLALGVGVSMPTASSGDTTADPHQEIIDRLQRIEDKLDRHMGVTPPSTTVPPPPTTTTPPPPPTTTQPPPTSTTPPTTPPPTSTTPPPPANVPVGSRIVFHSSFTNGFYDWATIQQKGYNSGPTNYKQNYRAAVVNDGPEHTSAARFEVRPGDVPPFGGGERSELIAPEAADVRSGDERWYQFDLKFDKFPPPEGVNGGYHSIVMQWHPGSGSPPFTLGVDGQANPNFIIGHRWDRDKKLIGPTDPGVWHRYVVHVKFHRTASQSFVEVYRDGKLVVPWHSRQTMNSDENYFKLGIYRGQESTTQSLLYDNLIITAP